GSGGQLDRPERFGGDQQFARRVWSPGTRRLLITTEALGSIELTSGATSRLITPSASTVGVKARLTPNCLNCTEMALSPPLLPLWATGIGNSPPARKLAVSPDSATNVGSASVVTTPFLSRAFNVASMFSPPIWKMRVRMPKLSTIPPSDRLGALGVVLDMTSPVTGSVCVVVVEPSEPFRLAPPPNAPWKPLSPLPWTNMLKPRSLSAPR